MEENNGAVEETANESNKNHKKVSGTIILAVFIAFVLIGYTLLKNETYQNYKNDGIPVKAEQYSDKTTSTTNDNQSSGGTTNQNNYAKINPSALSAEEIAMQTPPPKEIQTVSSTSAKGN